MNYTKEQLKKIFKSLPEDLQEAITSVESAQILSEIGNKFKLHIDQQSILGEETGYVLLGVSDPMEFVSSLSTKIGIDRTIASQIVSEINEKIFVKIKESLRQIHSGTRPPVTPEIKQTLSSNLIKEISTKELNIPKEAMSILKGESSNKVQEKKSGTEIFGFSKDDDKNGHMDIMEQKMKTDFSLPKTENGLTKSAQTQSSDPYREPII
jgi:hypothetical protein